LERIGHDPLAANYVGLIGSDRNQAVILVTNSSIPPEFRTALRSEDFASRLTSGSTFFALQLTWKLRLSMGYWISGSG